MANIEKRGKGRYRLNINIGYDAKGVPIRERKTVKAKNDTEAKKLLSLFEAEILSGHYIAPEKMTLEELYKNEWLTKYAPATYRSRPLQENINLIERRILPTYGRIKISDLKPIHVINFVEDLKKSLVND